MPNLTTTVASLTPAEEVHCMWVLFNELGSSRVRLWDVAILVPNALFLLILLVRLRRTIAKLQHTASPIFTAFYTLVLITSIVSVCRCVVSMTVNAAVPAGEASDKVLWLILRFFLLATELSVVIFGLAFGHLDSRTSIRRVLLVTFSVALVYSVTQGVLEFAVPDQHFRVTYPDRAFDAFSHGGMVFWFATSLLFLVFYLTICVLPFTRARERFALPTRRIFYVYCLLLAVNNILSAVGSGMLIWRVWNGLCVVDVTSYIYFVFFAPLVYLVFLRDFFSSPQLSNILFSYKHQIDESLDDDALNTLPHVGKLEADLAISGSFDSTHFHGAPDTPRPLTGPYQDFQPRFGRWVHHAELQDVASFTEGPA